MHVNSQIESVQHSSQNATFAGKLWIPASAINLAFVQPSLRVLYVNTVFVAWTVILSLMLNKTT